MAALGEFRLYYTRLYFSYDVSLRKRHMEYYQNVPKVTRISAIQAPDVDITTGFDD
jgi:hypothetical protein